VIYNITICADITVHLEFLLSQTATRLPTTYKYSLSNRTWKHVSRGYLVCYYEALILIIKVDLTSEIYFLIQFSCGNNTAASIKTTHLNYLLHIGFIREPFMLVTKWASK